jgi:hypothetical protein
MLFCVGQLDIYLVVKQSRSARKVRERSAGFQPLFGDHLPCSTEITYLIGQSLTSSTTKVNGDKHIRCLSRPAEYLRCPASTHVPLI